MGFRGISRNSSFPPTQDLRTAGNCPCLGTDVSPGAFSLRRAPRSCPRRDSAPGEDGSSPGLLRSPTPCAPNPGPPHGALPDPKNAQKSPNTPQCPSSLPPASGSIGPGEPGRALGAPVLRLSAGAGLGGRERRGRRDVADELRLFCRRQERGDEREAPRGSGCAV